MFGQRASSQTVCSLQFAQPALQVIQRFEVGLARAAPIRAGGDVWAPGRAAANLYQRINHACTAPGWNPAVSSSVLARPKEGESLYGPTSTRVRLFGPGSQRHLKALVLEGLPHRFGDFRLHGDHLPERSRRQLGRGNDAGGWRRRGGLLGGRRRRRLRRLGCGLSGGLRRGSSRRVCRPRGRRSGAGGVDDTGTAHRRCRLRARIRRGVCRTLAGAPSDASLAGRCVFCPTTYPMANATANSSTTIKKPLSSCLLPTTSSNSPVSLFLMF